MAAAPLGKQLELAKSLRKHGGDERIMQRERQIEGYLTQEGLSDDERHAALKDLRAAHAMRRYRSVSVYVASSRISARISAYNRMAGDRWEPKDAEDRRQLKLVEHDFELTKQEFKDAATSKAYSVLMASAQAIFDSLGRYGITDPTPVDSAIKAVHLGGKSPASQAALWLEKARAVYGEAYNRRGAVSQRARYAKVADDLIGLQERVRKAAQAELKARHKARGGGLFAAQALDFSPAKRGAKHRPKDPAHAAAWDALQQARLALDLAWIEAERAHPALAAHRGRDGELADVDLGRKGMPADARLQSTLAHIVRKLVNVHEAIAALEQGKLEPLSLKPVVRATRADLLIPAGSTFDPAVKAGIAEAGETSLAMKIIDAVMFALSFSGVGALAAGGYELLKEYAKYESDKRLSNTALDATRSISDADPSLTSLVLAVVDVGLSAVEVRAIFKEARRLKAAMLQGDESARKALDELGERHGVANLSDEVAKREKPGTPPSPAKRTEPQAPDPPRRAEPKPAAGAVRPSAAGAEREREALRARLRGALQAAQPSSTPGPHTEWAKLEHALRQGIPATAANDAMLADLRRMHATMRDPDALVKAADALWAQARAAGRRPETELVMHYGRPLPVLTTQRPKDFWRVAAQAKPFMDRTFAGGDHGAFIHVFQMYVLDTVHGPGTGQRFRQNLAKVTGEVTLPSGDSKDLRDLVWDALFDEYNAGNLNAPEVLGPILRDHIGLGLGVKKR